MLNDTVLTAMIPADARKPAPDITPSRSHLLRLAQTETTLPLNQVNLLPAAMRLLVPYQCKIKSIYNLLVNALII